MWMYPLCFLPFCLPQGPLHMNCVYIVSNSGYSQSAFTVALTRNVCVEWILGSFTENVLKCTLLSNVDRICPDMFLDHYTFKALEFYQSLEQLQLMLTCQTNPVLLDRTIHVWWGQRWAGGAHFSSLSVRTGHGCFCPGMIPMLYLWSLINIIGISINNVRFSFFHLPRSNHSCSNSSSSSVTHRLIYPDWNILFVGFQSH